MSKIALIVNFLIVCLGGHALEIHGHRGSRGTRPENTLPAFAAAIEAGADAIELDLLVTREGILVIHHDYTINNELCTHMDGSSVFETPLIRELSLAELKQYDFGTKTDPAFPQQVSIPKTQIPTLQELIDFINTYPHPNAKKIRLNLEIKTNPLNPELTLDSAEFAKKVVDLIKENNFSNRVYYSSFDPFALADIRKLDSKARIIFLFSPEVLFLVSEGSPESGLKFLLKIASDIKAEALGPDEVLLKNAEALQSLKSYGFRVIAWCINDLKRGKELVDMGIDGIITDFPQELSQLLK